MTPADEATHTPAADSQDPQPAASTPTADQAPPEKDWKAEYARLREDYNAKANKLKEFEKLSKPEEPKKEKAPEGDTLWLIENAGDLKLVKEEFAAYKAKGYSPDDALRLAKLDKGIVSTSQSEAMRQAQSATAPAIVNRETSAADVQLTETDVRLGVKPETIAKFKHLVEGQG